MQDQVKMQGRKEELEKILATLQAEITELDSKITALTKQKVSNILRKKKFKKMTELKVLAAEKQQRLSNQEKVERLTKEKEKRCNACQNERGFSILKTRK